MQRFRKLNRKLIEFIEQQKMFFVATAAPDGRVNLSPKGADTLRVIGPNHIRWMSLSGSGNETAGHLKAVNRITMMFCAFEGAALILRCYGTARVIHPRDPDWEEMIADFPTMGGTRQVFDVTINLVQTSCGTGVPVMTYEGERAETELVPFYAEMGAEKLEAFWKKKNVETIDGMPTGLFED
jgi:hypothetical protein